MTGKDLRQKQAGLALRLGQALARYRLDDEVPAQPDLPAWQIGVRQNAKLYIAAVDSMNLGEAFDLESAWKRHRCKYDGPLFQHGLIA